MANSFRQLFQFSFTFLAIIFEKLPCVLSLFYALLFMHFLFADFMQHFQLQEGAGLAKFWAKQTKLRAAAAAKKANSKVESGSWQ